MESNPEEPSGMQRSRSLPGAQQVPGRLQSESVVPGPCHARMGDRCHQEARPCLCLTSLGGGEEGQDYPEDCMSPLSPAGVCPSSNPGFSVLFCFLLLGAPGQRGRQITKHKRRGGFLSSFPSPFPAHTPSFLQFFLSSFPSYYYVKATYVFHLIAKIIHIHYGNSRHFQKAQRRN